MNIMITIAYDGTMYSGWQIQKNAKTIQGELTKVLSKIHQSDVTILGSSRTDKGVHALCQKACFEVPKIIVPLDKLPNVANRLLNDDIKIVDAIIVHKDFHPIAYTTSKKYVYTIQNGKFENPIYSRSSYYVKKPLDINIMNEACKLLIGTHDFKGFSNLGTNVSTTVRTIYTAKVTKKNDIIEFEVSGDGFLYNMVRIIVGTLISIGLNKDDVNIITEILEATNRKLAGRTAPPNGLVLMDVQHTKNYIPYKSN